MSTRTFSPTWPRRYVSDGLHEPEEAILVKIE